MEWWDILDTWCRESRCADNFAKTVFLALLGKLMKCLKSQNLVSGFRACSIFPLGCHEVLKQLPCANFAKFSINQSVLEVQNTNCGITGERKRKAKRGKKVIPDKRVLNVSEFEEENDENILCSSSKKKM